MTQTTGAAMNTSSPYYPPIISDGLPREWVLGPHGWYLAVVGNRSNPAVVQTVNVNVGNSRGYGGRAYTRRPLHHGTHIVMSILTAGMWLPVYAIAYAWSKARPRTVTTW